MSNTCLYLEHFSTFYVAFLLFFFPLDQPPVMGAYCVTSEGASSIGPRESSVDPLPSSTPNKSTQDELADAIEETLRFDGAAHDGSGVDAEPEEPKAVNDPVQVPVQERAGPQHGRQGRKEMFYLTTHSTHFIYGYMASDIWLRTILIVRKETRCIGYHSDSEKGNPLHRLFFPINSKGSFICTIPQTG